MINSNLDNILEFGNENKTNQIIINRSDGVKYQVYVKRWIVSLSGTSDITINTGIAVHKIFDIRAFALKQNGSLFPLPSVGHQVSSENSSVSHNTYDIAIYCEASGVIHIKPYSDRTGYEAFITVYYTH